MEKKQKSHIRPIVYVMISVFLIIGYAYLTSSLTINGASLLKKATWDVHFENVQVADGSVTGEQVTQEPEIDSEQTTVTFHVNLKKPGDYYEFTVDAVNAGTIDAMVDNYNDLELTEDQQKYLETSITYEDGEEVLEHQQLLAGDTAVYKVRVAYKLDLEAGDLPSTPEQLDLEFSVGFVQRNSAATRRLAESALYNVLKNEAKNGGLAIEYTGAHQDSMDSSRSTKKIYHWKVNNQTDLTNVNAKNNVYFGGYCWKILRTTDTGGVKLIYNGAAYEATCAKKGPDNQSFGQFEIRRIGSGSYAYGANYTYDEGTKTYTLIDTVVSSYPYNNRYSCLSSSTTCSTLYYLVSDYYEPDLHGNWSASFVVSTSTAGSSIASAPLTADRDVGSINYAGYKVGPNLYAGYLDFEEKEQTFSKTTTILSTITYKTNVYYSKEIEQYTRYSSTYYRLVNPVLGSTIENGDITGYYTINSTSETGYSSSINYVVGLNSGTSFYSLNIQIPNSLDYYNYVIGNGYIDNGDGTYTITNSSVVTQNDWLNNYSNYTTKYLCTNNSSTCTNPLLLVSTTKTSYTYIEVTKKILIAKNRDDLNLTQTKTVNLGDWLTDYESYSNYKYTCNSDESTCTAQNLRFIVEYNSNGYKYNGNNYWGSSVTWDGSNYTLVDPITNENELDFNKISTHHYICSNIYQKTCSSINYIYYLPNRTFAYYVRLYSGDYDPNYLFNRFFTGNQYDSFHKTIVDKWYTHKLINYDDQIEDVIYCNDRSIYDYGGWNANGGDVRNPLLFNSNSNNRLTLACTNSTDKFSISNEQATLKYKIALPTATELYLDGYRKSSDDYYDSIINSIWTMTPNYHSSGIYLKNFDSNYDSPYDTYSISPTISLKPNSIFTEGDGSLDNPYYIGSTHSINYEDNDLDLSRVGSVGKRIRIKLKDDEYRVTSFKLNGETMTGRTFIMPDEDVTITDVVKTKAYIVESEHNPYSSFLNKTYLDKTFEGAVSLDIELTYQTDSIYLDWIYLYDDSASTTPYNNERIGGQKLQTRDITLNSNYLKIVYRTDGSANDYYGFKAAIMPIYD